MKTGKKDKMEGKIHQAKGKVKEVVGEMVGNSDLESEGKAEKLDGKIQKAVGYVKKFFGK